MAYLTPDMDPTSPPVCRVLRIPAQYLPVVSGALGRLTYTWAWEAFGDVTPEQAAADMMTMLLDYYESEGCMIGSVITLLTLTPPDNILLCDGQQYARADYPLLYERSDAVYHVDANTGRVPDLRNGFVKGWGVEMLDNTGGEAAHTLTAAEMPIHDHSYQFTTYGDLDLEAAGVPEPVLGINVPGTTGPAGGGQAHQNEPPYTVLAFGVVAR